MAAELSKRKVRRACSNELLRFIKEFWPVVEPIRPYVSGWAIEAICEHLEAVSSGELTRLLMNVPPGFMKSLATSVFWPAWEWGPLENPSLRYLAFSYTPDLTERDNGRFADILKSRLYQELWGKTVRLPPHVGVHKVYNRSTGWKIASSVGGVGTGERADRVIVDDPHNVKMAESETVRQETVRWFRESITSRMNDPESSAIVVIMQRVHEEDVAGTIIGELTDYTHLCIPMEFDGDWRGPTSIGWTDPRTDENELAFPERYPEKVVERDKIAMGPTASAAQFQQTPTPRGGNIIERIWWLPWPAPGYEPQDGQPTTFPPCSLLVGSIDTAYGEKDENAWNAMVVFGVWSDQRERPKTVLMEAWRARLPLRGVIPPEMRTDQERKPYWGLAEKIADTIRRRKLDIVLIENKTRGNDLAAELRRLLSNGECTIVMIDPRGDKVARLHACQALFADGMVYAPDRAWADMVITEVTQFPKSKWADLTDCVSQCLTWLRAQGVLQLGTEADTENLRAKTFRPKPEPRYDV
jgi:predicted phage terminase large subunit-like protein